MDELRLLVISDLNYEHPITNHSSVFAARAAVAARRAGEYNNGDHDNGYGHNTYGNNDSNGYATTHTYASPPAAYDYSEKRSLPISVASFRPVKHAAESFVVILLLLASY